MAEKVNYFDGVKSHFDELQIKVIEVPEWDLVGDKAIYAKPFNMLEKSKLFKNVKGEDLNILIDIIIEKSLNKEHEKMFTPNDKLNFKTHADTDVVARVANQILGTGYDDIKKSKLMKPTIKKYLYSYTRSKFLRIDANEAAISIFLPVQRFKKGRPY